MKNLVIYGAGGFGKEVASLIVDINKQKQQWNILGFIDDNSEKSEWFGYKVLGNSDSLKEMNNVNVVIAIGNPQAKKEVHKKLGNQFKYPTLIHPTAQLLNKETIDVGDGCLIMAGAIGTCDLKLGDFVTVNLNSTLGHDCIINDYVAIMCGVNVAGGVHINETAFLGSGVNVLNGIKIGKNARVGAGAVVTKNVRSNKTVVGVPAKSI